MSDFTHIDDEGRVRMVDVSHKEPTKRVARAGGTVLMKPETLQKITGGSIKKGNVLETARIAGVMAAKKTWDLIPMCHPLNITHAEIDFFPDAERSLIKIESRVSILHSTGVEMEALTAVAVAALTIYDMCKSYDREMTVSHIRLLEKTGGKSGVFKRDENS